MVKVVPLSTQNISLLYIAIPPQNLRERTCCVAESRDAANWEKYAQFNNSVAFDLLLLFDCRQIYGRTYSTTFNENQ
jgi:hypothetical protein